MNLSNVQTRKGEKALKLNLTTIAVLALLFIVVTGGTGLAIPKLDIENWLGMGTGTGTEPVDKKLKLALTDELAGSALTSKTVYIYLGSTLQESLTTGADGTIASAFKYASGTQVSVKYVDTNTKQWFHFEVPEMWPKDAESATYNDIELRAFSVCAGTDVMRVGGTTIADAGNYNFTASGVQPQFTYDFYVTNDNTGFKSSQDPIYGMGWYPVVYMSLSGTNYETVLVYDFADSFVLGTTHWCAERVTDESITKYLVGTKYVHKGEMHFSYSLDGTGYSGTGTTMQLYLKIYSDPAYMKSHGGSFGPDVVELAETTVTLQS